MQETLDEFLKKLDRETEIAWNNYWRINYVSAVQPRAAHNMPGIVDVCAALKQNFMPERIRVVQLAPDQHNEFHSQLTPAEVDGLRQHDVEVLSIDARKNPAHPAEPGNVRILADFFDFS